MMMNNENYFIQLLIHYNVIYITYCSCFKCAKPRLKETFHSLGAKYNAFFKHDIAYFYNNIKILKFYYYIF